MINRKKKPQQPSPNRKLFEKPQPKQAQVDIKDLIRSEEEIASVIYKRAEMDKKIDLLDFESQIRSKIIEMIDPILQKTLKDREDIKHQN